ncbi:histidine kinase dimerization/phosphoacceptor domain -containing protein [Neorhizobium sp. DAR64860/K0K1]|uniref:histidine kinase dimerization/phosphoacceptor domain -containing protein n=1 Tax=Neorhizobium sp. DAR64860/K0K1 TaxID=3421955 RepID=UPI003D26546B
MRKNEASPSFSEQPDLLDNLLLRETYHRCSNDLQLVVSLLSLQSRLATNSETRDALADAMARVSILARARSEINQRRSPSLGCAIRGVCEALPSQAEPRSILISTKIECEVQGLS